MLVVSLGLDYLIPDTTSRPAGLGHVLLQVLDVLAVLLEGDTNCILEMVNSDNGKQND